MKLFGGTEKTLEFAEMSQMEANPEEIKTLEVETEESCDNDINQKRKREKTSAGFQASISCIPQRHQWQRMHMAKVYRK